jgi:hypothetical protein
MCISRHKPEELKALITVDFHNGRIVVKTRPDPTHQTTKVQTVSQYVGLYLECQWNGGISESIGGSESPI